MQKNVQLAENVFIHDLGTGFSYINFDRSKLVIDGSEVTIAAEQYRVKNPADYGSIVNAVVKENYPHGSDEAALRKGIVSASDPDFVAFNNFVESIKAKCRNEGI